MTSRASDLATLRRMVSGFFRLMTIGELSYPMNIVLQQLGVVLPVFLFYFVARLFELEVAGGTSTVGDYYTFAAIGVIVAALLQGVLTGYGRLLQDAQTQGTLETLLVEPIPWVLIPIALNLWQVLLSVATAVLMLLISAGLGADYRLAGLPDFAVLSALGILSSTAIGVLASSLMLLAKRAASVLALYGLAASLFAGTIFPVQLIPDWLRWVSFLVPHTYLIDVSRQLLMDMPPSPTVPLATAVSGLVIFDIVVLAGGLVTFSWALQYSRRMGLLSGY